MPARVSKTIAQTHLDKIKAILENILTEMRNLTNESVVLVNCRLNQTGKTDPAPVWVGWTESPDLKTRRFRRNLGASNNPPPRLLRGTHVSPIYTECLNNPKSVASRDFAIPNVIDIEKRIFPGAFGYDVALGLKCRRYICIKAGKPRKRRAGTLTVGLAKKPSSVVDQKVRDKLKSFAQKNTSTLVKYLENNLTLGGPLF